MGRRVIVTVLVLGALIAGGQLWLLTSLLSRPLPSGKTGWERLATVAEQRPVSTERRPDMLFEVLGSPYAIEGCPLITPGQTLHIPVRVLARSPDATEDITYYTITWNTPPTQMNGQISTYNGPEEPPLTYPFEATIYAYQTPSQTATLYLYTFAADGVTVVDAYSFTVVINGTVLPSFSTVYVGVDDCGPPILLQASVEIQNAVTWSYQLYNGATPISGGSPGAGDHELSGCSGYGSVTDIPENATSITFTATNGNGSSSVSSNLDTAIPEVSISSDPTGIEEGQDATLNWTAANASSVSIDNGVGVVWMGDAWLDTPSGSVEVSPSETTTYTITATGFCQEVTDTVTVNVQGVPRPGMASITWVAQEGIGSRKTAHLTTPAVLSFVATDPSRTPQTARVLSRSAARVDVRTPQTARVVSRSSVRGNMTARVVSRATSRKPISVRVLSRARGLYPDRFHIKARNTVTGAVAEWGVVDADASPLTLADVSIPAGTYMVWVEREGLFWKDARLGSEMMVVIADGQAPVVLTLPMATGLAAEVSRGLTTLTWTASSAITDDGMLWGLWFNATSPVSVAGEPDYSFMAMIGQDDFTYTIMQSASQYVAVAAIGTDGTRGVAAELYLGWSTAAPSAPINQTAIG